MISNPENRDKTRFYHESTVTLDVNRIGALHGARMYNYSDFGLYIESDYLLEPETEVQIGIANSPFAPEPDQHENLWGIVQWRKSLKRSAFFYGYGVKLLDQSARDAKCNLYNRSRKHPRIECAIPLKYEFDSRTFAGTTMNVSRSGVFIKTRDPVAAGKQITVYIPTKKKGKLQWRQGRVVWSNRTGFGVKFERSI
jgi:hypothetical protein